MTDRGAIEAVFRERGLEPHPWSNGPGDTYGWHDHPYRKVLCCLTGSITFHTSDGDIGLAPGEWMELPAGTRHAATVGPTGVTCLEAPADD
ncbi:MAG: cupin [Acidimicrobiia bacterium]|jgi:quercetin dioxygenase-like cupin family protein|nr:cupin [Acidimicrobiia bacterium]